MEALVNPQKCRVSGHYLNYFREGKGEVVLLVHGITTYSFIWASIFHSLKSDYDVIAVDLLGCGASDKPIDVDYSLKNQANLLNGLLNALTIRKVHFVGHDVGGGIAQIFTVRYPELVASCTLINTVAYDFWPVQPIVAIRTPIIRQLAMATLNLGMFKLIVHRGVFYKSHITPEIMNYFFAPMRDGIGRKAFLHFARCLNNHHLLEIADQLKQLLTPMLIVRGNADVYLGSAISEKLHAGIPGSELVIVPDAGHFIQFDVPEKLYLIILKFIKSHEYGEG